MNAISARPRVGFIGAGQVTKLLNNVLFTAHLGTAVSLLSLGQSLGVDSVRLADVISHGSGNSFALQRAAGTVPGATVPGVTVLAADDDALARMNVSR